MLQFFDAPHSLVKLKNHGLEQRLEFFVLQFTDALRRNLGALTSPTKGSKEDFVLQFTDAGKHEKVSERCCKSDYYVYLLYH